MTKQSSLNKNGVSLIIMTSIITASLLIGTIIKISSYTLVNYALADDLSDDHFGDNSRSKIIPADASGSGDDNNNENPIPADASGSGDDNNNENPIIADASGSGNDNNNENPIPTTGPETEKTPEDIPTTTTSTK